MLRIERAFVASTTTAAESGDTNQFLQSVLVEVATENYRQLMYEEIFLTRQSGVGEAGRLDPPLRANERVMSGLFANAIAKTAARSRPEVRVDRDEIEETTAALDDDENLDGPKHKSGRVDFLAWYGQRTFAIELKVASLNCETAKVSAGLEKRWIKVVAQSKQAQDCLRARTKKDGARYPNPVSLSLMVVIGKRSAGPTKVEGLNKRKTIEDSSEAFIKALNALKPRPRFQALYTFPEEFRCLVRRRQGKPVDGEEKVIYTPFVAFLARAVVNRKKGTPGRSNGK